LTGAKTWSMQQITCPTSKTKLTATKLQHKTRKQHF